MASTYYFSDDSICISETIVEEHNLHSESKVKLCVVVVIIQRMWKGYNTRRKLKHMHKMATLIQKTVRGWIVRWNLPKMYQKYLNFRLPRTYNRMATKIQAAYRGYSVRKTFNIKTILEKRRLIQLETKELQEKLSSLKIETVRSRKTQQRIQFLSKVQNFHHLLGTKHIAGIFSKNPPHSEEPSEIETLLKGVSYLDYTRTMHKLFVEQKATMKSTNLSRSLNERPLFVCDCEDTPLAGPFVLSKKITRERYDRELFSTEPHKKKRTHNFRLELPEKNIQSEPFNLHPDNKRSEPEIFYYPQYFLDLS